MKIVVKFLDKICWHMSMIALASVLPVFLMPGLLFIPLFLFGFLCFSDDITENYKKKNRSKDYPNKKACRIVSFVEPKGDNVGDYDKANLYPIYEVLDGMAYNIKGDMRVERAVYPEGTAFEVWFSEDMKKNYTPDLDANKKITHGKLIASFVLVICSILCFKFLFMPNL